VMSLFSWKIEKVRLSADQAFSTFSRLPTSSVTR
jgi:hypothetical protein